MQEILERPLTEIAAAVKSKQITSVDLTKIYLDRIEQVNSKLNAVVRLNTDNALKYAAKADAELAVGQLHGPLHGIPMTIKDSLDTKDMITTWGTKGRENYLPGNDATAVSRLRSAGAILLGKTNTPEFTLSFKTDNLLFGSTHNPYDLDRTPGGSSGGAAALIAAQASLFDVGTDTGGSIRLPAHFCGIAGIKPTSGRVPCTGNALPSSGLLARLSQPGPMARNTQDLELLLNIMSGPDYIDPYACPAPLGSSLDIDPLQLRVGYHFDNGIKTPSDCIVSCLKNLVDLLKSSGFNTSEARPSGIEMTSFIFSRVFTADGGDMIEALLDECQTQEFSKAVDTSDIRQIPAISQQEFAQVINLWDNFRSSMLGYFKDFDVLICPVNGSTAIALDEDENMANYSYTNTYNLTGWPSAVVRTGTDKNGLPIGVQVIAAPFREDHCLSIAGWIEAQTGPFESPSVRAL